MSTTIAIRLLVSVGKTMLASRYHPRKPVHSSNVTLLYAVTCSPTGLQRGTSAFLSLQWKCFSNVSQDTVNMNSSNKSLVASSTIAVGIVAALWNFSRMFSAWVVAPQKEVVGSHIMFLFTGVVPIIGVTAGIFRKRWGAWTLLLAPIFSSVGFLFLKDRDTGFLVYFVAVYYIPILLSGLGFLYLTRKSAVAA